MCIVKFGHSEKATKIWNNLPLFLTFLSNVKERWKIVSNFCGLLRMSKLYYTHFKRKLVLTRYLISKFIYNESKCQKYEWMINNTNVPFKATKVMIRFWIVNTEPWFCSKIIQTFFCSDKLFYWFKNVANLRLKADYFLDHYNDYFSQ